jgi:hypothetical protein
VAYGNCGVWMERSDSKGRGMGPAGVRHRRMHLTGDSRYPSSDRRADHFGARLRMGALGIASRKAVGAEGKAKDQSEARRSGSLCIERPRSRRRRDLERFRGGYLAQVAPIYGEREVAALREGFGQGRSRAELVIRDLREHEPVVPVASCLLNGFERSGETTWRLR